MRTRGTFKSSGSFFNDDDDFLITSQKWLCDIDFNIVLSAPSLLHIPFISVWRIGTFLEYPIFSVFRLFFPFQVFFPPEFSLKSLSLKSFLFF